MGPPLAKTGVFTAMGGGHGSEAGRRGHEGQQGTHHSGRMTGRGGLRKEGVECLDGGGGEREDFVGPRAGQGLGEHKGP